MDTRLFLGVLLIGLTLLAGCGKGGLYSATVTSPQPRVGMTAEQVQQTLGPSWDKVSSTGAEVWRYGYNILGLIGPSCNTYKRGGAIGCIAVHFYAGRVSEVVYY